MKLLDGLEFKDYLSLLNYYLHRVKFENIDELTEKGYLNKISGKYILSPTIRRIIYDSYHIDEKEEIIIHDDHITQYRNIWKGLKPGSMGSPGSVKKKLKRWMEENPDYSFNDILKAAQLYVNKQENLKYLQRADYFIYKQIDGDQQSRLSAWIEEINEVEEDGWTTDIV